MHAPAPLGLLLVSIALTIAGCSTSSPPILLALDQTIRLEPDQGILIVEVDASEAVQRLVLQPTDRFASTIDLEDLAPGRRARLLVLPGGLYRWSEIDMKGGEAVDGRQYPTTWRIDSTDDHWHFSVRPGVVNYPGMLVLERVGPVHMRMYTLNRSAQLIESVGGQGGRLVSDYPIAYSGRGRDDFLEFYASKLASERMKKRTQDGSSATSN